MAAIVQAAAAVVEDAAVAENAARLVEVTAELVDATRLAVDRGIHAEVVATAVAVEVRALATAAMGEHLYPGGQNHLTGLELPQSHALIS